MKKTTAPYPDEIYVYLEKDGSDHYFVTNESVDHALGSDIAKVVAIYSLNRIVRLSKKIDVDPLDK